MVGLRSPITFHATSVTYGSPVRPAVPPQTRTRGIFSPVQQLIRSAIIAHFTAFARAAPRGLPVMRGLKPLRQVTVTAQLFISRTTCRSGGRAYSGQTRLPAALPT